MKISFIVKNSARIIKKLTSLKAFAIYFVCEPLANILSPSPLKKSIWVKAIVLPNFGTVHS